LDYAAVSNIADAGIEGIQPIIEILAFTSRDLAVVQVPSFYLDQGDVVGLESCPLRAAQAARRHILIGHARL